MRETSVFDLGIIFLCTSAILFFIRYYVLKKVLLKEKHITKKYIDYACNGHQKRSWLAPFGTEDYGHFRQNKNLFVTYRFWKFLRFPIFPIGCFVLNSYHAVVGSTKWRFLEVVALYIQFAAWVLLMLAIANFCVFYGINLR